MQINETQLVICIIIVASIFFIWNTITNARDQIIENQKKIIELLEKEHNENK